jgi:plastocyanin
VTSTVPSIVRRTARRAPARAVALLLAAAAGLAAPRPGGAQAVVSGQLTLLERPGGTRADLATAVVYLEPADGSGGTPQAPGGAAESVAIAMRGREFVPHVRVVRAGAAVAFPNQDPFSHNVFSNSELGAFDLGLYRRGASRTAPFERPGVYAIYCNIHHRMATFVVATPTEHAARAGADGRFVLRGVPPGRYLLHAWHERAPEVRQPLVVGAGGADVRVALDAREYVPAPHLNKFGLPYTVTRADRY